MKGLGKIMKICFSQGGEWQEGNILVGYLVWPLAPEGQVSGSLQNCCRKTMSTTMVNNKRIPIGQRGPNGWRRRFI